MIAIPRVATSAGFAGGALLALYPNQLVRSTVVECIVIGVLGALGCLVVGRFKGSRSLNALAACALITSGGVVAWALWQNELRAATGNDPVAAGAIAAVWATAVLPPCVIATIRQLVPRRLAVAVLGTAMLAGSSVFASGTAAAGVPASPARTFESIDSVEPGLRIYQPLGAESIARRTDRAVDRLIAAGGLSMRAIVVTLPTGSGWVDARFVRGAERALDGRVAILAVQYTEMLSWQAYWFNRSAVREAAAAVVDSLHRRLPADAPPVYFYGQSLGALGVEAALERAEKVGLPVTGSLVAGPPAIAGDRAAIRLVNSSDPVVVWGVELAILPPRSLSGCVLPGEPTPAPPWAPVASFLQASVDLLQANDNRPGMGHRYDERQGSELFAPVLRCG